MPINKRLLFLGGIAAVVIIIVVVIVVKGSGSSHSGGGNTPIPPDDKCHGIYDDCSSTSDCCKGLTCENKVCMYTKAADARLAFQLKTTDGKHCVGVSEQGIVGLIDECDWNNDYWSWDGTFLYYVYYETDAGGKSLKDIKKLYINGDNVAPGASVQIGPKNSKAAHGIILTEEGTIQTKDYQYCTAFDKFNQLVWQRCVDIPSGRGVILDISTAANCSQAGDVCNADSDCCPPFKSCGADGKCSVCFGDEGTFKNTNCPGNDSYVYCDPDDNQYHCKNKCEDDTKSCPANQEPKCMCLITDGDETRECKTQAEVDDMSNWQLSCVSRCQGPVRECNNGMTAICTNKFDSTKLESTDCDASVKNGDWGYCCPINPCGSDAPPHPPFQGTCKDSNSKNCTYNPNSHYWECPDGSCRTPQWDCHNQKYNDDCIKVCCASTDVKCDQTCAKSGDPCQKLVCSPDTDMEWKCVSQNDDLDYCGMTPKGSRPTCSDAICVDISGCDSKDPDHSGVTTWRWRCESQINDPCELRKLYDWPPPISATIMAGPNKGNTQSISLNEGNVPIYPTVDYDHCREGAGSDTNKPDAIRVIANPKGWLRSYDHEHQFYPADANFTDPAGSMLLTSGMKTETGNWDCLAPNPCYSHGTYSVKNYPVAPKPKSSSEFGPFTTEEMLSAGSCACAAGYAGSQCQYDDSYCNNNGTVKTNPSDPMADPVCTCNSGYIQPRCKYNNSYCNNHGTVKYDNGIYSCDCDGNYSGSTCNVAPVVTPVDFGYYKIKQMTGQNAGKYLAPVVKCTDEGWKMCMQELGYVNADIAPTWRYFKNDAGSGSLEVVIAQADLPKYFDKDWIDPSGQGIGCVSNMRAMSFCMRQSSANGVPANKPVFVAMNHMLGTFSCSPWGNEPCGQNIGSCGGTAVKEQMWCSPFNGDPNDPSCGPGGSGKYVSGILPITLLQAAGPDQIVGQIRTTIGNKTYGIPQDQSSDGWNGLDLKPSSDIDTWCWSFEGTTPGPTPAPLPVCT